MKVLFVADLKAAILGCFNRGHNCATSACGGFVASQTTQFNVQDGVLQTGSGRPVICFTCWPSIRGA